MFLRYPQIRPTSEYPTSEYGDSRIRHGSPGPSAGTDHDPERSAMLTGALAAWRLGRSDQ